MSLQGAFIFFFPHALMRTGVVVLGACWTILPTCNMVKAQENPHRERLRSEGLLLRLWEAGQTGSINQERARWQPANSSVQCLAYSPDGKLLASIGNRNSMWIRDVNSGKVIVELKEFRNGVHSFSFSPDGKFFAASDVGSGARIWQVGEWKKPPLVLEGATGGFLLTAFTSDSSKLVIAPARSRSAPVSVGTAPVTVGGKIIQRPVATLGEVNVFSVWNVMTGKELLICKGTHAEMNCAALSPDGAILASGSLDGTVKLWDLATGQEKATMKEGVSRPGTLKNFHGIAKLNFSPDGNFLAAASNIDMVHVWNMKTLKWQETLFTYSTPTRSVCFLPDNRTLAIGGLCAVQLWDFPNREPIALLGGFDFERGSLRIMREGGIIHVLTVSPDGKTIATGNSDRTVSLWDIPPPKAKGK